MMVLRRRRKPDWWEPEFDLLSTYNAERARGIAHTPEWVARMERAQARYNVKVD